MRAYERLLKYVKIHTTSDPNSGTHPSTLRQFDLAKILVEELKELGLTDAHVDEHCYVYATLPATPGQESAAPLGLIAHMDTADDASGENVRPQIHENYDGEAVTQCTEQGRPRSDRMRAALSSGGDAAVFYGLSFRISGGKT